MEARPGRALWGGFSPPFPLSAGGGAAAAASPVGAALPCPALPCRAAAGEGERAAGWPRRRPEGRACPAVSSQPGPGPGAPRRPRARRLPRPSAGPGRPRAAGLLSSSSSCGAGAEPRRRAARAAPAPLRAAPPDAGRGRHAAGAPVGERGAARPDSVASSSAARRHRQRRHHEERR